MNGSKSKLKEFCTLFWTGLKGLASDYKGFCNAMWGIVLLLPLYVTAILCYGLLLAFTVEILYVKIAEIVGSGTGLSDKNISEWLICAITTAIVHGLIIMTRKDKYLNDNLED